MTTLLDVVAAKLQVDAHRWPDRHGNYHADCPYCHKPAKKGQTHFCISAKGLCYCQVCQQGTTLHALAEHLGIAATSTNGARPETTYDYYDAAGVLAYQVVRYYRGANKHFFQRRPNGADGWVNNLQGVDRVLYRLPELTQARERGETIYIAEGEKDVEMLRVRGLAATTNVAGAGKWQDIYSEALRGADVVILPDNDSAGQQHAQQVRQSLQGIAKSVKVVRLPNLPDKGDVSDWLAQGHTVEELRALVAKPVELVVDWHKQGISAADLQKTTFPPLKWIIDGILPEGATLLAGKPKSKKSWMGLAAGVAVAMGGKVLSYYDVSKGTVLYLDLESNQRRMKSRLGALLGSIRWPPNLHIFTKWERGETGIARLDAWMEVHPDTLLIVIDILQNFRPIRDPKANPYDQDYEAVKMINEFAERHRISVIIIHHTRKAKADDVFDEISGTTGLSGGVASMWVLGRSPDNTGENILAIRGRDISDDDPMALRWDGYTCQFIRVASGQEVSSGAARRAILEVMDEETEYQLKEIAAATGKSVSATSNLMRRLMDDNLVQRVGNGRYARIPQQIPYQRESSVSGEDGVSGESSVSLQEGDDFHFHILSEGDVKVDQSLSEQPNEDFHDFHADSIPPATMLPNGVPSDYVPGPTGASLIESIRKAKKEREEQSE